MIPSYKPLLQTPLAFVASAFARMQFSGHLCVSEGDWGQGPGFVLCYISSAPAVFARVEKRHTGVR